MDYNNYYDYCDLYIHVHVGSSFFLGKVTALGVLCCLAIFILCYYIHVYTIVLQVMWSSRPNHSDLVSQDVNGSAGHYIITHLRPVTNYTVIIYAKNSIGKGKGIDERNIATLPTGE